MDGATLNRPQMADRVYSKEETDAILARAIELQGHGEATSHAELVATAREIGIAPQALEKAAVEVLARRRDNEGLRALRARRWRGFYAHLVPFVCVGMLLGFINIVTGGFPWAIIPMLAWGTGLASHLLAVASADEQTLRRRLARQRERENLHAVALGATARVLGQEPRAERVRVEALREDPTEAGEGEAELEQTLEKTSRSS